MAINISDNLFTIETAQNYLEASFPEIDIKHMSLLPVDNTRYMVFGDNYGYEVTYDEHEEKISVTMTHLTKLFKLSQAGVHKGDFDACTITHSYYLVKRGENKFLCKETLKKVVSYERGNIAGKAVGNMGFKTQSYTTMEDTEYYRVPNSFIITSSRILGLERVSLSNVSSPKSKVLIFPSNK